MKQNQTRDESPFQVDAMAEIKVLELGWANKVVIALAVASALAYFLVPAGFAIWGQFQGFQTYMQALQNLFLWLISVVFLIFAHHLRLQNHGWLRFWGIAARYAGCLLLSAASVFLVLAFQAYRDDLGISDFGMYLFTNGLGQPGLVGLAVLAFVAFAATVVGWVNLVGSIAKQHEKQWNLAVKKRLWYDVMRTTKTEMDREAEQEPRADEKPGQ